MEIRATIKAFPLCFSETVELDSVIAILAYNILPQLHHLLEQRSGFSIRVFQSTLSAELIHYAVIKRDNNAKVRLRNLVGVQPKDERDFARKKEWSLWHIVEAIAYRLVPPLLSYWIQYQGKRFSVEFEEIGKGGITCPAYFINFYPTSEESET